MLIFSTGMLVYLASLAVVFLLSAIGGRFLPLAKASRPRATRNPAYAAFAAALLLGFIAAFYSPDARFAYVAELGTSANAIFAGFFLALVVVAVGAILGYLSGNQRLAARAYKRSEQAMESALNFEDFPEEEEEAPDPRKSREESQDSSQAPAGPSPFRRQD